MKISHRNLQSERAKAVAVNFFVFAARAALETIVTKTILLLVIVTEVTV